MRRKKVNRTLTFLLAAAVIAGSIHWVAADTNKEVYEAPELTLEAGAQDYDLTEGIVYDSALYELAVLDTGDFDINVPGAYEVTYSLTPITETPEGEDPAEDMDDSDALDPDVDGADQDGDTADQPDTGNGGDTTTGADNGTGNANSGDTTANSGNAAAESDAGASMTTGDATAAQSDSGNDAAVQSVEDAASTQAIIKVNDRVIVQAGKSQAKATTVDAKKSQAKEAETERFHER